MTPESDTLTATETLINGVERRRPTCACGRVAQRGRPVCWFCDADVPAELKAAARGRGMKRKGLDAGPVELRTVEGRQQLRATIAELVLRDELAPSLAQVALKALDGAAQDEERLRARVEPVEPLEVRVTRFASEPTP